MDHLVHGGRNRFQHHIVPTISRCFILDYLHRLAIFCLKFRWVQGFTEFTLEARPVESGDEHLLSNLALELKPTSKTVMMDKAH